MKGLVVSLGLLSVIVACNPTHKRISYGDGFAEGLIKIGTDTLFEGDIIFYDASGKKISSTCTYKNNKEHGEQVNYYDNGITASKYTYVDGIKHGEVWEYDSIGQVEDRLYQYHGVTCGPWMTFKNNKIVNYNFYTFDGIRLFCLQYDSLQNDHFKDPDIRCIQVTYTHMETYRKPKETYRAYFINLFNPPLYPFRYSLCKVDSTDKVMKEVQQFDNEKVYDVFMVDAADTSAFFKYAVKVDIYHGKELIHTEVERLEDLE